VLNPGCVIMSSAQCASLSGTYKGNGTNCADDTCRIPNGPNPIVLWNNGPFATGTVTSGGVAAPAGAQWSEAPGLPGGCASTTSGFQGGSTNALADDFTIPTGETWTITDLEFYVYAVNLAGNPDPTIPGGFNLKIWPDTPVPAGTANLPFDYNSTGIPLYDSAGTPTVDTFTNVYRIPYNTPGTTRPVWKVVLTPSTPIVLGPGKYWLNWFTFLGNGATSNPVPQVTTPGIFGSPHRNAYVHSNVQYCYKRCQDMPGSVAGNAGSETACGAGSNFQDMPFEIRGTVAGAHNPSCANPPVGCYPNCDGSTIQPCLNVQDFGCFLNKFANGESYANCDNSTIAPVLNVQDFGCFLNSFAIGCSSC
jgi:hypothetical protein